MITVIGGGAAGMMAAISAAENNGAVTLVERNDILGKKILITGKGRCNLTNACQTEDIFLNIPTNSSFLYSSIYSFSNYDVMDYFEKMGVPLKVERGERVFPQSDKARDIAQALSKRLEELGVRIINDKATDIVINNGKVTAVKLKNGIVNTDRVILATGGMSYPRTGSDGSGYTLAKKCGHTITPLKPTLVALETKEETSRLMGLSLKNVSITVKNNNKTLYTDFGEMLFTHFGISGPTILSASCHMGNDPEGKVVEIDLKPALDEKALDERILRDFSKFSNKDFRNSLCELLPVKLIDYIIEKSGIDPFKKVNSITKEERKRLLDSIKHLTFTVKKYRSIEEAIVTSGGVCVKEINASTMESKIVKGLYFAGEIIDVDAYTGGFNLQIAFSTGYLAGKKASQAERGDIDD